MTVLDDLLAIAADRGCRLELRLARHGIVAELGSAAVTAATPSRALRALADELAPRPLRLCQHEEVPWLTT